MGYFDWAASLAVVEADYSHGLAEGVSQEGKLHTPFHVQPLQPSFRTCPSIFATAVARDHLGGGDHGVKKDNYANCWGVEAVVAMPAEGQGRSATARANKA